MGVPLQCPTSSWRMHMPEDAALNMGIGQRQLAADAMIEMFGNDAPNKAMSRAAEYRQKGEDRAYEFWTSLAQAIREVLEGRQRIPAR